MKTSSTKLPDFTKPLDIADFVGVMVPAFLAGVFTCLALYLVVYFSNIWAAVITLICLAFMILALKASRLHFQRAINQVAEHYSQHPLPTE